MCQEGMYVHISHLICGTSENFIRLLSVENVYTTCTLSTFNHMILCNGIIIEAKIYLKTNHAYIDIKQLTHHVVWKITVPTNYVLSLSVSIQSHIIMCNKREYKKQLKFLNWTTMTHCMTLWYRTVKITCQRLNVSYHISWKFNQRYHEFASCKLCKRDTVHFKHYAQGLRLLWTVPLGFCSIWLITFKVAPEQL